MSYRNSIKLLANNFNIVWKQLLYILVVSLIFALYHCDLNFILSGDYMEVLSYAPLFFVGLGLNWLYEISNNIWCPILVHMIINILA